MQGLQLVIDKIEIPEQCDKINQISFKLASLFYADFTKEHRSRISNCLLRDNLELKTVEYAGITYPLDQESLKLFNETQSALKNQKDIFTIFSKEDYRLRVKNGAISADERNRIYAISEKLRLDSSLFAKLMQISLYLDLNQKGKVEVLIKEIVNQEFTDDLLLSNGLIQDDKTLHKRFKSLLLRLKQNFDDEKMLVVLGAYLAIEMEPALRDIIIDLLDIPLKQSHVLDIIKSHNYGSQFPFVWTPWIEKYGSTTELDKFLQTIEFEKQLAAGRVHYLGLLRSFFPIEQTRREHILNAYNALEQGQDAKYQDLKFRLIQNEDLQKYRLREKKVATGNFVEARKFYREQLMKNQGMPYALYQLLVLGDLQEEYFVKMLAFKSYGL